MSRSGYSDDLTNWSLIRWRGAVESAIRGKRGQAFLKEMLDAFDALPEKKLITGELIDKNGCCCAIGAVCKSRELDVTGVDPYDRDQVAELVGVAGAMVAEIEYMNDETDPYLLPKSSDPDEFRYIRIRAWVVNQIEAGERGENNGIT